MYHYVRVGRVWGGKWWATCACTWRSDYVKFYEQAKAIGYAHLAAVKKDAELEKMEAITPDVP